MAIFQRSSLQKSVHSLALNKTEHLRACHYPADGILLLESCCAVRNLFFLLTAACCTWAPPIYLFPHSYRDVNCLWIVCIVCGLLELCFCCLFLNKLISLPSFIVIQCKRWFLGTSTHRSRSVFVHDYDD